MIIIKVINQKVVQVAFSSQTATSGHLISSVLATKNPKQIAFIARSLVQSARQEQKITNATNQQLIPIARNISFRQCCPTNRQNVATTNSATNASKAPFSISSQSHFISADSFDQSIFIDEENKTGHSIQSPLEALKKKAKDIVEQRESNSRNEYYGQSFNETLSSATTERRLVVLMSWLQAKEKHIEKYRQFYLDRGFDVLNVKTSPLDLLLPTIGAKKISKDFVRFLIEKQYSDVVLHGFSVGGYMFGQVLLDIDKQKEQTKQNLLNSIRGLVFDSLVPFEGTCVGVANAITPNKYGSKILETLLRIYLVLGHNIATKYYLKASDKVWGGPLKCPSLFLMSKDDIISDYRIIERLADVWTGLGLEAHKCIFDSSPHVQLYHKHHDAYVDKVENFLQRIKML